MAILSFVVLVAVAALASAGRLTSIESDNVFVRLATGVLRVRRVRRGSQSRGTQNDVTA